MDLEELAKNVAQQLRQKHLRLVLAESCTAGRIAASLGLVPGISQSLCGSAVVYRAPTKTAWLGVAPARLAQFTAESAQVTADITQGVLQQTPEADVALGVTGHLGPHAPVNDGLIHLAICQRDDSPVLLQRHLQSAERSGRQSEASCEALTFLLQWLQQR